MKQLYIYFRESLNELTLVTWPKQDVLVNMTILTVIFVLISAVILGVVDFGLLKGYQWFLTLRS